MTTNAQVDGDTAKVTLNASGTTDSGKWTLEGGCFTPPDTSTPAITCGEGDFLGLISTPYSALDKSSQVTVVKHGGRWFVSPVGTVLDVVDKWISTLDRRTLFTMIGIPNQLPPDGSLTLGKPFELNAANRHLQVLTFDGHKGQKLLGLAKSKLQPTDVRGLEGDFSATSARLFAPDGSELTDSSGLFDGQPVELPADGTYTVAVQSYGLSGGGDVTVTIWNAADAPAAAKNPVGMNGSCTYSGLIQSCSSSSAVTIAPSNGPLGQLGLNPMSGLCDANGHAVVGGNLPMMGADGKPLLDENGCPGHGARGHRPEQLVRHDQELRAERRRRHRVRVGIGVGRHDRGRPGRHRGRGAHHEWVRARGDARCSPTVAMSSAAVRSSRPRSCTGSRVARAVDCAATRSSTRSSRSANTYPRCRSVASPCSGISFRRWVR